jgi:uncharacterized protein
MAEDTDDNAVLQVVDNRAAGQYEVHVGDEVAVLTYRREGNRIVYLHTGVPPALEGRGIAGLLASTALEEARAEGLEVIPLCPYVAAYIKRHQEYLPLVSPPYRKKLTVGA